MKKSRFIALSIPVILALSACSAGGSSTDAETEAFEMYGHTIEVDQELADRLPADFAPSGTLTAPNTLMEPIGFTDEQGNDAGVVPDLVHAIAAKLGLEAETELTSFDAQVPGVLSGKYSMTTLTGDFESRRDVLEMVDFLKSGFAYIAMGENPEGITEFDDMCGLTIGTLKGASQEETARQFAEECASKGLPEPTIQSFSNTLLSVPLKSERVDVIWDNVSTFYGMEQEEPGVYMMPVDPTYNAYIALGVAKGNEEARDVLQETVQALIDDGIYQTILEQWGQEELGVETVTVNSDIQE